MRIFGKNYENNYWSKAPTRLMKFEGLLCVNLEEVGR